MLGNQTVAITIFVLLIVGLSLPGAFLAAGYGTNELMQHQQQWYLQVIQEHLADLKELLLDYRNRHGRYPTNDEGLAAIDNFKSKVPLFYRCDDAPPDNGQPLGVEAEPAVDKNGNASVMDSSGVPSSLLLPFMYENRSGIDAAKFAFSPVNGDSNRRYSVLVDKGVYVYSLNGRVCADTLDHLWWEDFYPVLIGFALLATAIAAATALFRGGRRITAIAALAVPVVLGGLFGSIRVGCYATDSLSIHRSPQMAFQQKNLLDKYLAAGVISEDTYRKSLAAVEPEKPQPPAETKK